MSPTEKPVRKNATYSITEDLLTQFDKHCDDNRINKSGVMETQMRDWLDREQQAKGMR